MPQPDKETSTCEGSRLRRCIRDLVALSALPAVWIGYDPRRIAESLADVLMHMLHLDLINIVVREEAAGVAAKVVVVKEEADGVAAEVAHTARGPVPADRAREFAGALAPWLGLDSCRMPATIPNPLGDGSIRIVSTPFDIGARSGVLIAGSRQADFPTEADRLLLGVGANQAAILFERRRADEQLQESQRQLTDFVENATEGLQWLGPDGIILWANKAEMDLLGYPREEYIGRHIAEFHADPAIIEDILRRLENKEQVHGYEARLRCKDGSIKHVLINSDVQWEDGKFIHTRCFTHDITERKRAEEALREGEARLRFTLDATKVGQWDLDFETNTARRSLRHDQIFGYDSLLPEWSYDTFLNKHVYPADRAYVDRTFQEALASGKEWEFECRIVRTDHAVRWIWAKGIISHSDTGRPMRMLGLVMDITARKQAEEAVLRLASIVEFSDDAIFSKTLDGIILSWNRGAERIYGYSAAEVIGRPISILAPPDRSHEAPDLLARVRRGECIEQYETVRVRKDGKPIDISLTDSPIKDPTGKIVGASTIVRDITARKRADEALRRERDFAESLIETARAIVLVLDTRGRIVRFNPYAEAITGYRFEEVQGRDWFRNFLPEGDRGRIARVFSQTLADINTSGTVNMIITKDGREREIEWSNTPLKDPRGAVVGVLSIGHDITDLKEAQRRALQAERLAAIGQVVAGLAHESRNALQRSQACLEMLALELEDRPDALDLVAGIQEAQDDLHLLYVAVRNYAAPLLLDRRACRLGDVLHEAWADLALARRGRTVELREHGGAGDLACAVDRSRLKQVFRNVLDNALAACHDPVEIDVDWAEGEIAGRPAVRIAVRDNGPGLNSEQRRKIFEPFYTTKTQGTGLGLAIARRIVEAHGGRITTGPGPGPGAEILILLPGRDV